MFTGKLIELVRKAESSPPLSIYVFLNELRNKAIRKWEAKKAALKSWKKKKNSVVSNNGRAN